MVDVPQGIPLVLRSSTLRGSLILRGGKLSALVFIHLAEYYT